MRDGAECGSFSGADPVRALLRTGGSDVSFDVFVQRFHTGTAAPIPAHVFEDVVLPHAAVCEPRRGFWRLQLADGGEADVYARIADGWVSSLMMNHVSRGRAVEVLAEVARCGRAAILAPGCPVMLGDPAQREHLPAELIVGAVLISSGSDIEALWCAG